MQHKQPEEDDTDIIDVIGSNRGIERREEPYELSHYGKKEHGTQPQNINYHAEYQKYTQNPSSLDKIDNFLAGGGVVRGGGASSGGGAGSENGAGNGGESFSDAQFDVVGCVKNHYKNDKRGLPPEITAEWVRYKVWGYQRMVNYKLNADKKTYTEKVIMEGGEHDMDEYDDPEIYVSFDGPGN